MTRLGKPLTRLIAARSLVVRITEQGIQLRGYRKHRWRLFTWDQIASLAGLDKPITRVAEINEGKKMLAKMGAK